MAMAAWSAKVSSSAIWLSVNGPDFVPVDEDHAQQLVRPEHGDGERGPDTAPLAEGRRCTRGRAGRHGCGRCVARGRRAPRRCRCWAQWDSPRRRLGDLGGGVVGGHHAQELPVEAEDERAFRLAQPDGVLGQRLEDRLEVEGGSPDHLEQLAGGRLLLQGDPQLAVARLQLGEQADVLDGDDGLVGEGLQQIDLPGGEPSGCAALDEIVPIGLTVPEHRHGEQARPGRPGWPDTPGPRCTSGNSATARVEDRPPRGWCVAWAHGVRSPQSLRRLGRHRGHEVQLLAVEPDTQHTEARRRRAAPRSRRWYRTRAGRRSASS